MCSNRCDDAVFFHAFVVFFNDEPRIPEEKQNPESNQKELEEDSRKKNSPKFSWNYFKWPKKIFHDKNKEYLYFCGYLKSNPVILDDLGIVKNGKRK